jgi:hypothetical protein
MLALFLYFIPRAKIRFVFWFVLSAGTIAVPVWLVAGWYIGWDVYHSLARDHGTTNVAAHLAGAAVGLGLGLALFRDKRHWAQGLVVDKFDLTKEESWLTKLKFLSSSLAALPALFIGIIAVAYYVVRFVENFGWKLLLIAPAVAASYHLYRRRTQTDYERYRLGAAALEAHDYSTAFKYLKPLAARKYPRAMHALGWLHLSAHGALRDEREAVRLLTHAAERGHAEAQHLLGTMYADGRGVLRSMPAAIEWYEKAVGNGLPDAAMSLGHICEHGIGVPADRERATGYYHRAVLGFSKARRTDDADAALRALNHLAKDCPAAPALVAALRKDVSCLASTRT